MMSLALSVTRLRMAGNIRSRVQYSNRAQLQGLNIVTHRRDIEWLCFHKFRAKPGPVGVGSESEYQTRTGPSCFAYPTAFLRC